MSKDTANNLISLGVCVIPVKDKIPTVPWKEYQDRLPRIGELSFNGSMALVCGRVSKVEAIDIDTKNDASGTLIQRLTEAVFKECPDISEDDLLIQKTPSGGAHLIYRCEFIEPNQKLAQNKERKVLIETRGTGGYVCIAPSPGYELLNGSFENIPTISPEQREHLFSACRSMNEYFEDVVIPKQANQNYTGLTPWQDYNERADVPALLQKHGWSYLRKVGENVYFCRPDKKGSVSGSWNGKTFYCFTSSTIFDPSKAYSAASVFAYLECNKDFTEAARKLYADGFGERAGKRLNNQTDHNKHNQLKAESARVVRGSELLRNPSIEVQWLVKDLLPKSGISILAGMSDLGKSAWLRQLGVHLVANEDFFCGYKLNPTHNKTIILASEDDESATCSLLHKVCDNRYTSEQVDGLRFIFDVPNSIEETLRAELNKEPADLVIVDCLMDFMGRVNINVANEVRAWLNPFKRIASEFNTHIVFLHHLSKRSDEREPNKASLLGSGALEQAPRCVMELRIGEDLDTRYLCILKANYLSREVKENALEMKFDNMRFTSSGITRPKSELVVTVRNRSERSERVEQVKKLAADGLSQRKIAKQLGIGVATVNEDLHRPF